MKEYTIVICNNRSYTTREVTGSMEYLREYFNLTLKTGKSYENEKGNTNPKTLKSLVTNLNNDKIDFSPQLKHGAFNFLVTLLRMVIYVAA